MVKKKSLNFYKALPSIGKINDYFKQKKHTKVPKEWYVIVTDVVKSTEAIEAGRYKDVNTVGGLTVMAISNVFGSLKFPFVFGGDGAVCLVPPDILSEVSDILFDAKLKVKRIYDLDLRIGLVPVKTLYAAGKQLYISKVKVSPYYSQAILDGDGIYFAEELIKAGEYKNRYIIQEKKDPNIEADFTGFTCRWEDVPSSKAETIATVIKIRDYGGRDKAMQEILKTIKKIFGGSADYHPISTKHLKMAHSGGNLKKEARVFSKGKKGASYLFKLGKIRIEAMITQMAMTFNIPLKFKWYKLNLLKQYQVLSADFIKFDGSLKMVMSCDRKARQEWEDYLKDLNAKGEIFYGIQVSDRAVMTCLLHSSSKQEVHFIDGANGGYALAAKQMKVQMKDALNFKITSINSTNNNEQ